MGSNQIKAKLKELNDYFVNKIVSGEYEITERVDQFYKILIDGQFVFLLWIANGPSHFGCFVNSFDLNTMYLEFTAEGKEKAFKLIEADKKEIIDKEKEERDRKEFERLKAKFG